MKIVDVNILLYAGNSRAPQHEAVLHWWERALDGDESIGLAWVVLHGYLRISTNRSIFEQALPMNVACRKVENWMARGVVSLIRERENHWQTLHRLLSSGDVLGNLVADAHLATLAIDHGATLVSCDNDFRKFPEVRWLNPLHVA